MKHTINKKYMKKLKSDLYKITGELGTRLEYANDNENEILLSTYQMLDLTLDSLEEAIIRLASNGSEKRSADL